MLKTERKQLILEELNQHHVVSLEKLVSLLETSESTVCPGGRRYSYQC